MNILKKKTWSNFLAENKITYFHFEKLGGYQSEGYENYLKTKDFKKAIKNLTKITKKEPTLIICAERLP